MVGDSDTSGIVGKDDLEQLDVQALCEHWVDVESTRTPVGWAPGDARRRATIARRLTEMVCSAAGTDAVEVDLDAVLAVPDKKPVTGKLTRFGELGVFFATTKQVDVGSTVDIEVRREDQKLRVRGEVVEGNSSKLSEAGLRIKLTAGSEADERRVHRLLNELLRHRT